MASGSNLRSAGTKSPNNHNNGRMSAIPRHKEMNASTNVSDKNWRMIWRFRLPITFRMPISRERRIDCTVDKLMKLIAAMINIKPASAVREYKVDLRLE